MTAKTVERSAEVSGAAARVAGAAEAAAIRARTIRPLPPREPVPDMLYVEVDGTGVPVARSETEGRKGKGEDGQARTREIKLARFFTVSRLDSDGNPVTDPGSSSYVATFDGKDALAGLVEAEYLRRGGEHFRQVVAIGDGAAWIWTMAGALYPHATHITDIYHAREHLHDLAAHLAFITPDPARWLEERSAELDAGNIEAIITAARQYPLDRRQSQRAGHQSGLLRAQCPPDALPALPRTRNVHRLGPHRSRLQSHRRPAREAVRHALDHHRRSQHHHPALPARQRPVGRALDHQHPHPGRAPDGNLTDPATQTRWPQPPARSFPTKLTCTRLALAPVRMSAPGASVCCMEVSMSSGQLYDTIGATYTVTRRTEPRIAAQIWGALGDARTILNVGAGTGSYEPPDRHVLAVEPSALMRAQRPAGVAPCVAAPAESLPFEDQSFDAAMAIATIDHWQDPIAGLREMRRVARRVVVFTHDTSDPDRFWLTRDYLPEHNDLWAGRPSLTELACAIVARIKPFPIPWDCARLLRGLLARARGVPDENVRRGISVWARVGPDAEQRAVHSLRSDLGSGRWAERNRDLVNLDTAELDSRLLIA